MKTFTKTLIPTLALSLGIFANSFAQYEEKIFAGDGAAGDKFAEAVSIDGEYAIVGAQFDDDGTNNSGSAYIYKRSGTTWAQQAKITASDASEDDNFGISVGISGDYAIVGAYKNDDNGSNSGSAYIFVRSGTSWTEQAKITASDAAALDEFGVTVSIDGDYAAVGALANDDLPFSSGSAYVFARSGTSWSEQAKLTASDAAAFDEFGCSISIKGDDLIVGARKNDDGGNESGSAYVFTRSGTSWSEQAKLTASDAAASDFFGYSVSIDGDYVVVGSYQDDDGGSNSGSAYVFTRSGVSWSQQAKLTASDGTINDAFGTSVGIEGDNIIVGAPNNNAGVVSSGAAYSFNRSGVTWTQQTKLAQSELGVSDGFGLAVAISSEIIFVGNSFDDDNGTDSGSASFFAADGGDFPLAVELDSFQARQIENTIQLNWTTASEKDNEGFNVYRKTGNSNFVEIASYKGNSELLGALNSTTSNNYTFVDNSELRNGETYTYYISDVETNGLETKHVKLAQTVRFTLNEEIAQTKLDYVLAQNFPNPFNPSTKINFQIAKTQDVKLQVYNLKGELVKELVNEKMSKGSHSANWNGTDSFGNQVSSGTYFYKISAGTFTQTNKMILLK
ncbi:MAG: T9SS C-terminal target domain-containing protein [Calditrichaeota bacterium]|nr:MAG: T9SS C-terminal target domain-containing protein [Calditrichota bacterium]